MDYRDVENFRHIVEFQSRMLQAEIAMQGMIAENKHREQIGQSIAYGEEAFQGLISTYAIGPNDFPYYGG